MKKTKDKPITPQQLKALQACFNRIGMDDDDRHDFICHFTDGRTASTKFLSFDEARKILAQFNGDSDKREQAKALELLKAIYHLSMRISFLNADFKELDTVEDFEMNKAKINVWCRTRTKYRKNITLMSVAELKAVKKQMEAIVLKEETKKI